MIYNMVFGGGGVSLNVTAYASLNDRPASGNENDIALITSTTIGNVTINPIEPTSGMVSGDVWIQVDDMAEAMFSLMEEKIEIPLGEVLQYNGTTWVKLEGYLYCGTNWVELNSLPDGNSAEVNNSNTWLRCASINPATYSNPSLADIVADSDLCDILMGTQNSVNYMIRSTAIQTAVLGSSVAISSLDQSNKFVSEVMTSATTPTGYSASASSSFTTSPHYPYMVTYVCNDTNQGWWAAANQSGDKWVRLTIPESIWVYKIQIGLSTASKGYSAATAILQQSDDGTVWEDISTGITNDIQTTRLFTVQTTISHDKISSNFRILFTNPTNGSYYYANNLVLYGKTKEVSS